MSIDYDRLEELVAGSSPGPWTVEVDEDFGETVIANKCGHERTWGDQVRFEMAAGNPKCDPQLVALAPVMARELLRIREILKRA